MVICPICRSQNIEMGLAEMSGTEGSSFKCLTCQTRWISFDAMAIKWAKDMMKAHPSDKPSYQDIWRS
jgi:hypothetical protein